MTSKEKIDKIIEMRFKQHMRPSDIAKKLGVSKPYITKVIKTDKRYFKEKASQKTTNKKKNKDETKKIIYEARELEQRLYEFVKLQHIQASKELSYEVRTTTDNNRKCNIINPDSIKAKYKYFGCRAI